MLHVDNLHVSYGRITAVRGISLEVNEGEVVGLLGLNGAGKSSTFGAIAGLLKPSAGEVRFGDVVLTSRPPEEIVRRGVALVPEGRRIFTTLTVEENLRVAAGATGPRASVGTEVHRALERFPLLGSLRDRMAGSLSGGQQQLLAIARSLVTRPRLLLMDEPSLGLAPVMVDVVFDAIRDLRDQGTTVVMAEQYVERTLSIVDRVYVLSKGTVAMQGTATAVKAMPDFRDQYLVGTTKS
ncbi:MAG: branched-chain amino acid transport system ATP-binding protein [Nocardioidaceae bacterium]|nr:branched-chain amino acid transport system ATP-binding protein [Nocardioidaceae bacterium]